MASRRAVAAAAVVCLLGTSRQNDNSSNSNGNSNHRRGILMVDAFFVRSHPWSFMANNQQRITASSTLSGPADQSFRYTCRISRQNQPQHQGGGLIKNIISNGQQQEQRHIPYSRTNAVFPLHMVRPDEADSALSGPILWQYAYFGNWHEAYIRVLKYPEEAKYTTENGWTLLHLLMAGSGFPPPLKVVKAVYGAYPEALDVRTDDYGRTPLDLAQRTDQPKDIVEFLSSPPDGTISGVVIDGSEEDDGIISADGSDDESTDEASDEEDATTASSSEVSGTKYDVVTGAEYVRSEESVAHDEICIDITDDGTCIVVEEDEEDDNEEEVVEPLPTPQTQPINAHANDIASATTASRNGRSQQQQQQRYQRTSNSVSDTINDQIVEQQQFYQQQVHQLQNRQPRPQQPQPQHRRQTVATTVASPSVSQTLNEQQQQEQHQRQYLQEQQRLREQQEQREFQQAQQQYYQQQRKEQEHRFGERQPFFSVPTNGAGGRSTGSGPGSVHQQQMAQQQRMQQELIVQEERMKQQVALQVEQQTAPLQERIEELTRLNESLSRSGEDDKTKIAGLERDLREAREMERQMRSAHYAELVEANDAAEDLMEGIKTQIKLLKKQLEQKELEISELQDEKESERIELENKLEDATRMLATALKSKSGKGFGKSKKVP